MGSSEKWGQNACESELFVVVLLLLLLLFLQ